MTYQAVMLPHKISNILSTPITAVIGIIQGFHLFSLSMKTKLLRTLLDFADNIIVGHHKSHSTFSKLLSFASSHARLGFFKTILNHQVIVPKTRKKKFFIFPLVLILLLLPPFLLQLFLQISSMVKIIPCQFKGDVTPNRSGLCCY